MCGIGAGINSTASFAIIAAHYKEDREKTIGMMEAFSGIGLLLGPIFGGIMHSIGGFILPFVATCNFHHFPYLHFSFDLLHVISNDCIHSSQDPRAGIAETQ